MGDPASEDDGGGLRIVHLLRTPVGGLFRHVLDLARAQITRGHKVGLIVDSMTGGSRADALLAALEPDLALGLTRLPMRRAPHPLDLVAMARITPVLRAMRPDVVHGHGAKGALFARLPGLMPFAARPPVRVYTPHGGSLHYDAGHLTGSLILRMERSLLRGTDLILFESHYAAERFRATIGVPRCLARIVHNGLHTAEFVPITRQQDPVDFLYVGEMRRLKGVDVFLMALAAVGRRLGRTVSAALVGDGPDRPVFEALARTLDLDDAIVFRDPMPAREAFALGRILVVPSRAESLPYIVLEAAAAQVPLVATRVGGIPEIVGGAEDTLVPAEDVPALAAAMTERLSLSDDRQKAKTLALSRFVETRFAVDGMADAVLAAYRDALAGGRGVAQGTSRRPGPAHRPLHLAGR